MALERGDVRFVSFRDWGCDWTGLMISLEILRTRVLTHSVSPNPEPYRFEFGWFHFPTGRSTRTRTAVPVNRFTIRTMRIAHARRQALLIYPGAYLHFKRRDGLKGPNFRYVVLLIIHPRGSPKARRLPYRSMLHTEFR